MDIDIRPWSRADVPTIAGLWLEAYTRSAGPDAPLHPDARTTLTRWLDDRARDRSAMGYVAESGQAAGPPGILGFVLGRVGVWESSPPILRPRRLALIDAVFVVESRRKSGIGRALVDRAIERARQSEAEGVETTFESTDPAAAALWRGSGFQTRLSYAYRPLKVQSGGGDDSE